MRKTECVVVRGKREKGEKNNCIVADQGGWLIRHVGYETSVRSSVLWMECRSCCNTVYFRDIQSINCWLPSSHFITLSTVIDYRVMIILTSIDVRHAPEWWDMTGCLYDVGPYISPPYTWLALIRWVNGGTDLDLSHLIFVWRLHVLQLLAMHWWQVGYLSLVVIIDICVGGDNSVCNSKKLVLIIGK